MQKYIFFMTPPSNNPFFYKYLSLSFLTPNPNRRYSALAVSASMRLFFDHGSHRKNGSAPVGAWVYKPIMAQASVYAPSPTNAHRTS